MVIIFTNLYTAITYIFKLEIRPGGDLIKDFIY